MLINIGHYAITQNALCGLSCYGLAIVMSEFTLLPLMNSNTIPFETFALIRLFGQKVIFHA